MKLTLQVIEYITLFENLTGAKVKDCIAEEDHLLFVVEEGNLQKALRGKGRVEHALKKEIRLLGFSADLTKFIKNLIYPVQAEILCDKNGVTIRTAKGSDRGKIYGRSRERLAWITMVVKRYFSVQTIKVE